MIGRYIKSLIRRGLFCAGLDLTRNMQYDRLTRKIMHRVIRPGANCIDVGSHEGDVLKKCLDLAPDGRHFAFEPIPEYFARLKQVYGSQATVLPYALSDESGASVFQFVRNAPAYSGLKKRKYNIQAPDIRQMDVEVRRLDDVIPQELIIDFMKVDVEGAEFHVLKGGRELIKRSAPVIVFEFGLGASDYYDSEPAALYRFLVRECGLKVSLMKSFLDHSSSLSSEQFREHYHNQAEYYFVAHP